MHAQAHAHDFNRLFDMRCDGPRRPPRILSRRETVRVYLRDRERGYGHSHDDSIKRSLVLGMIDAEIDRCVLTRAEAHDALGLRPGSLDDGTLAFDALQAALAALRELPTPGVTPGVTP